MRGDESIDFKEERNWLGMLGCIRTTLKTMSLVSIQAVWADHDHGDQAATTLSDRGR